MVTHARWVVASRRRAQGQVIGEKGTMPWAEIDLLNHLGAVIVFGFTQREANARAAAIVDRMNEHSRVTRRTKRKVEGV
jgi:hypothetical protein